MVGFGRIELGCNAPEPNLGKAMGVWWVDGYRQRPINVNGGTEVQATVLGV